MGTPTVAENPSRIALRYGWAALTPVVVVATVAFGPPALMVFSVVAGAR
ncbi:hypothetical protein [Micropruina sp.]